LTRDMNNFNESDTEWHWHLEASARRLVYSVVLCVVPTDMFV